jgi:hypothetical protein
MGRKIRLTESEFHSLVRRLVREAEEEMMSITMDDEESEGMSKEDTVHAVADFFKRKLRRLDSDEIEELEDMVVNSETEDLTEMFLREDISDRKKSFKEKAMIRGGIGMMGAGILGMISQAMGYTDAGDLMIAVHDYVDKMGGGPVSTAVLIAGLVMALKGAADRGLRTGR